MAAVRFRLLALGVPLAAAALAGSALAYVCHPGAPGTRTLALSGTVRAAAILYDHRPSQSGLELVRNRASYRVMSAAWSSSVSDRCGPNTQSSWWPKTSWLLTQNWSGDWLASARRSR